MRATSNNLLCRQFHVENHDMHNLTIRAEASIIRNLFIWTEYQIADKYEATNAP